MIPQKLNRRDFVSATALSAGSLLLGCSRPSKKKDHFTFSPSEINVAGLPAGNAPIALSHPHFPSRLHAFVWRNWPLVPTTRLAEVIRATEADILRLGQAMGLGRPPRITKDQQRRSYITVIRRNWHLLPYEQLLPLLGWNAEELAYTLREDDFLFHKLGLSKPKCEPLFYAVPDASMQKQEQEIQRVRHEHFPHGFEEKGEPLFQFVADLSVAPPVRKNVKPPGDSLRFCYSYFALYGDPLLETETNPYPDGYLAQLAEAGVTGVWLQAVLHKLSPFPWDEKLSSRYAERLQNLRILVARARKFGISVYLYLNEPRSLPLSFFASRPQMKGVVEGDYAALCTSDPEVQNYLVNAIASIGRAVPELGGFFTITGSENLTNCWSHHHGGNCPRCGKRSPGEVIGELNSLFFQGIQKSGSPARLLAWDWGWKDEWAEEIINRLPPQAALMSVSEWDLPVRHGGVETRVGEYSISAIGPGPRAQRHWEFARKRGLPIIAKIQAGNTWELSTVPYIPALENVAQHAANLRQQKVNGLMLGWTLGGYPSPNLEVVSEILQNENQTPLEAMQAVAQRRFGKLAPSVVEAWRTCSTAFREFPFHGGLVYSAPMQYGPANLLWAAPTNYRATMVGFPYDDLEAWRAVYPPDVFIAQFEKMATGFADALAQLKTAADYAKMKSRLSLAFVRELNVIEAAMIHFRSVANQARFVLARRALAAAQNATNASPQITVLEKLLHDEIALARRLHEIQSHDSRIGFEASNHYFYIPIDLGEKVLNCEHLLRTWLPKQKEKFNFKLS